MSAKPAGSRERSDVPATGQITNAWLWSFTTHGLTLACGVITGILAARLLLPEGRGALAAIMFWPGLFWSIGLLSLREAVVHRIAQSKDERPTIIASGLHLTLALAAVTAASTVLLLPYLLGAERQAFWLIAQIYAVTIIPITSLIGTLRGIDQGELRLFRYNLWGLIAPLVHLSGLLALWALGRVSVVTALAAFWTGHCLCALALLAFRARVLCARPSWLELQRLLGLNLRFHSTSLASLLGAHIDRLAVMLFWDDVAVGLYVVALTWASAGLNTVTISFRTVLFPHLSAEPDTQRQHALLERGLRYASCLLTMGTLALAALTSWLLPLLFGASFGGSVPVALALLAAYLPLALRQIAAQSLRGLGRARPGTIAELGAIVVFFVGVWPLAQALGLLGVGLALFLGNLAALAYLVDHLKRHFDVPAAAWWPFHLSTLVELLRLGMERLAWARPKRVSVGVSQKPAERCD